MSEGFENIDPSQVNREELIRISRITGTPIERLTALQARSDPFYVGSDEDRERAKTFMTMIERRNISHAVHERRAWYLLVQHGELGQDPDRSAQEYAAMRDTINDARALGLIKPWDFPERKSRLLVADGRDGDKDVTYTPPGIFIPTVVNISEGEIDWDPLAHQPVRVLGLIEKDDDDVMVELVPLCRRDGVELRVTTGTPSRGRAGQLVKEAIEDARPMVVLWFSDADSSGEDFAAIMGWHLYFIRSRLPDCPPIYVKRVALTLDQVREIEAEYEVTVPRAPDVAREIGRVELNVLPVFAPGWLERKLREALDSIYVEIKQPEIEERDSDARTAEEVKERLRRIKRLADRLYAREGGKLRLLQEIRDETLDEFDPLVPLIVKEDDLDELENDEDRPVIVVPRLELDELEEDWVLGPERGYFEQLNAYRRHRAEHRDRTPVELVERICALPGCDETMEHRRSNALYCSRAHAVKAGRAARTRRRG